MTMAISTYRLGNEDNLSDPFCNMTPSREKTKTSVSNIRWTINQKTAEVEDDTAPTPVPPETEPEDKGERVQGGSAPSLTSGDCAKVPVGQQCTECATFYYENKPNDVWYECVDKTKYVYNLQCSGSKDMSKCATGSMDHCF